MTLNSDHSVAAKAVSLRQLLEGFADSVPSTMVSGLCLDSRKIQFGDAYVALQGSVTHGLDYIDSAIEQGAAVVLVDADDPVVAERIADTNVSVVSVPSLASKLGSVASRYYGDPSLKMNVCGVTGTDGKTSVCRFIVDSLQSLGFSTGYIGTIGWGLDGDLALNPLTTPDPITLQAMFASLYAQGAEYIALEVSSHALVQGRVNGVAFDVAVLTNLGRDHLDYHGDLVSYGAAKRMLFDWPTLSAVVVNGDDEFGRRIAKEISHRKPVTPVARFSRTQAEAEIRAVDVETNDEGLKFTLVDGENRWFLTSALLGSFNVENLLSCYGVLKAFGTEQKIAARVLETISAVPGRMERFTSAGHATAVVDFAHTPQALKAALTTVRPHCPGKLWVVFGCGGDRDAGKRAPMGQIAAELADVVVVTDDNPRSESSSVIINQICSGIDDTQNVSVISDRRAAILHAIKSADSTDWVLIAGKGHENYQLVGDQRLEFSDRAEVVSVFESLGSDGHQ